MIALALRFLPQIAGVLVVLAILAGTYAKGRNDERSAWVAREYAATERANERERQLATLTARQAADLEAARGKRQVVTQLIHEQVDRYVPMVLESDAGRACLLAGAVRVLHDAAAAGTTADASRIPAAAPVPPATLTHTIIDNYAACHDSADRLEGWQRWWSTVSPSLCTCAR